MNTGFPIGARVFLDGQYKAIVKGYFPKGSSFFPWAHYVIRENGASGDSKVQVSRIGVDRRAR